RTAPRLSIVLRRATFFILFIDTRHNVLAIFQAAETGSLLPGKALSGAFFHAPSLYKTRESRSVAALPAFATSSARTPCNLHDAGGGWPSVERPAPHREGSARAG